MAKTHVHSSILTDDEDVQIGNVPTNPVNRTLADYLRGITIKSVLMIPLNVLVAAFDMKKPDEAVTIAPDKLSARIPGQRLNRDGKSIWDTEGPEKLIFSVFADYMIPSLSLVRFNDGFGIGDGQQRLTNLWRFATNRMMLTKRFEAKAVEFLKHGGRADAKKAIDRIIELIAENNDKLKFNQLPTDLQNLYTSAEIPVLYDPRLNHFEILDNVRLMNQTQKTYSDGELVDSLIATGKLKPLIHQMGSTVALKKIKGSNTTRKQNLWHAANVVALKLQLSKKVSDLSMGSKKNIIGLYEHANGLNLGKLEAEIEAVIDFIGTAIGSLKDKSLALSTFLTLFQHVNDAMYGAHAEEFKKYASEYSTFLMTTVGNLVTATTKPKEGEEGGLESLKKSLSQEAFDIYDAWVNGDDNVTDPRGRMTDDEVAFRYDLIEQLWQLHLSKLK